MPTASTKIDFINAEGNPVAVGTLYPETDENGPVPAILCIPPVEAAEHGEAPVQLLEGITYEYELDRPGFRLREVPGVVRPSRTLNKIDRGRIMPGLNVGRLRLSLVDKDGGQEQGSAEVEVRASKVGYRDEYRLMLGYITGRCADLLLEFRSPVDQSVIPEDSREPETICQRFAFVQSLLTSRRFRDAVQRVIAMPHRLWEQEDSVVPLCRGVKATASVARQIASATRRIPLPAEHRLFSRISSIPEHVTIIRNAETTDTAENRFIKHALRTFQGFVANVRECLERLGRASDARFIEDAVQLEEELAETLSRDFFREISDPEVLPLGSPVLQRKGGYREILTARLQFDMAARLYWHGGADVYGAGKRDVATLYEYWLFFKLLEVVSGIFRLQEPPVNSLIKETADGFGLQLKSGRYVALKGEYVSDGRRLEVKFSYNRTFQRSGRDEEKSFPDAGSWTERMRPDYTLSLWPADFTEDEAERQEIIVHVHFDAKYRVKDIQEIFGEPDASFQDAAALEEDLSKDKADQKNGRYKRADLLKMHAYKDAIRRTAGAYVLYPGTQPKKWCGFHEIVPGLGAFGIRPTGEDNDGTAELAAFIGEVVQHVCDRATRREQESYHRYRIQDGPEPLSVKESPMPEYDMGGRRSLPLRETPVLVAWYTDDSQLQWTDEINLIVLRIGERRGAVPLTPENVGAYYILLHKKGQEAAKGLYRGLSDETGRLLAPEVLSANTLKKKYKYPLETHSEYYLVYHVEPAPDFAHFRWNIRQLLAIKGIAGIESPLPFCAMLDEVMNCAY